MQETDWANIGQALGAIGIILAAAVGFWKGHKKSDGKPPDDRPPHPNETKAKLEAIHDRIERLAQRIDHHHELTEDDRRDMNRQLDRIERSVERVSERLEADARIGVALARLSREGQV